MAVLDTRSGWSLSAILDHFIPKAMLVDAEQHRRARMFMLSHVCGPVLGNSLPAYLFFMNIVRDWRVGVFTLSITAFWAYPFLLRLTGRYKLLAFISVQNLAFCVLWACYAFGGLLSPFLPWTLIIPLLSFLYLPSVGWVRNTLLVQLALNLAALLFICLGPFTPPAGELQHLQVIGLVSMGAVAIYFAMMSLYFAKMFSEQREFARELHNLVSSSDNLRNLTAAAEQAEAAKANFIASMSHELRTPLNAIIGYSQLLLEEAEDEGDEESRSDLVRIHGSGSHLLYLIDHILDYSRIEAGRMPVNKRPDRIASAFPRWQAQSRRDAPGIELSLIRTPDVETVLMTDWSALGAIVLNLVAGLVGKDEGSSVELRVEALPLGAFVLELACFSRDGKAHLIDLSAEIFDDNQDVSPTRYGSMGIEPALALKYIQLLGGYVEQSRASNPRMRIIFPAVEGSAVVSRAA